jgi:hypothetical protein
MRFFPIGAEDSLPAVVIARSMPTLALGSFWM